MCVACCIHIFLLNVRNLTEDFWFPLLVRILRQTQYSKNGVEPTPTILLTSAKWSKIFYAAVGVASKPLCAGFTKCCTLGFLLFVCWSLCKPHKTHTQDTTKAYYFFRNTNRGKEQHSPVPGGFTSTHLFVSLCGVSSTKVKPSFCV